jgi:hypothetical protein
MPLTEKPTIRFNAIILGNLSEKYCGIIQTYSR